MPICDGAGEGTSIPSSGQSISHFAFFKCRCYTQTHCLHGVPTEQSPSSYYDQLALNPRFLAAERFADCMTRGTQACALFSGICTSKQSRPHRLGPACSQPLRSVDSAMNSCASSLRAVHVCWMPLGNPQSADPTFYCLSSISLCSRHRDQKFNKLLDHPSFDQAHSSPTCNHG